MKVALFINDDFKGVASFYSKERDSFLDCSKTDYVDTLSLYTLTPGVQSSFADIRICENLCPSFSASGKPLKADSTLKT